MRRPNAIGFAHGLSNTRGMGHLISLRPYRTAVFDNRRWQRFTHRPGDIFVCTPPKCGTTWTQTIIASLLWPTDPSRTGPDPAPVARSRVLPRRRDSSLAGRADASPAPKTTPPATAIPNLRVLRYVFVVSGRTRTPLMSALFITTSLQERVRERWNERARGRRLSHLPCWDGDIHGFSSGAWL